MTPNGFLVCAAQCNQCLFTKDKIVSDKRRRDLLKQIDERGNELYFECHKHTIHGRHVCCRGDYNRNPMRTQIMQVAARLGVVVFVDENGEAA